MGEDSVAFWNLKTRSTEDFASGLGGASNSGVERAIKWSEDFWVRKIFVGGREFVGLRKISLNFTSRNPERVVVSSFVENFSLFSLFSRQGFESGVGYSLGKRILLKDFIVDKTRFL